MCCVCMLYYNMDSGQGMTELVTGVDFLFHIQFYTAMCLTSCAFALIQTIFMRYNLLDSNSYNVQFTDWI